MVTRIGLVAASFFIALLLFWTSRSSSPGGYISLAGWRYDAARDADAHSLTAGQCESAFPRLYENIDNAVAERRRHKRWVTLKDVEIPAGRCMIRAMIYEGELRIIDLGKPEDCYVSNGRERIMATLHLLHRAVVSAPAGETLLNIEFRVSYDDWPTRSTPGVSWGFTRMRSHPDVWMIPDYGYWSWWAIGIPSFKNVWRKMQVLEAKVPWKDKIPKALWRGSTSYNPAIREKLLQTAEGKSWADVGVVKHGESDGKFIALDEHCKYQYLLQAEGTSYSGRLKYLQLCRSVIITHRMEWAEFATHLMEPAGPSQNIVQVERDWSDLASTMAQLLADPARGEAIAQRGHDVFARRYTTPAAVNCYLRRLFHGWARVQGFEPQILEDSVGGGTDLRGIPFEALAVSFPQDRPGEYGKFAPPA